VTNVGEKRETKKQLKAIGKREVVGGEVKKHRPLIKKLTPIVVPKGEEKNRGNEEPADERDVRRDHTCSHKVYL